MKQSQFWLLVAFMYLSSAIAVTWVALLLGGAMIVLSVIYHCFEDKE